MESGSGLSESLENYLEVILALEETNRVARAKDIADRMGVKRGSVTGALKNLEEKGYVNYSPYSYITLTSKGRNIARKITNRHLVIKDFLENFLKVAPEIAEKTACRMEHSIDQITFDRLLCFMQYIQECPRIGKTWVESFEQFCASSEIDINNCRKCIDNLNFKSIN